MSDYLLTNLNLSGPDAQERCVRLLHEDRDMARRREEVQAKVTRLEQAHQELKRAGGI